ncbi:MAG: DUF4945 domain-containing protein [Cyclobacteriaceae bacterium]
MKTYNAYFIIVILFIFSGCYQDEIIDSKPGEGLAPVNNLDYTISGDQVDLHWELPTTFPDDILSPVSVRITIFIDGQNNGSVVLEEAPRSYLYAPYEASKEYKFTVKVMGRVDTSDPYFSNLRYSPGKTVVI